MDLYTVNIMLGTFIASHIQLLHTSMIANMQIPIISFIVLQSLHVGYCGPHPQLPLGPSLEPHTINL